VPTIFIVVALILLATLHPRSHSFFSCPDQGVITCKPVSGAWSASLVFFVVGYVTYGAAQALAIVDRIIKSERWYANYPEG
jgi:hypothetical protein